MPHDSPMEAAPGEIHPMRTLWLLSIAHAVNHAQAVLLPLIFLKIIDEFGVGVEAIALPGRDRRVRVAGSSSSATPALTRIVSRRRLLGAGGILFGGGFAAQALATDFITFASQRHLADRRLAQHPVGNGLLAEQFPPDGAASRSAPTSRAAMSARSSWRWSASPLIARIRLAWRVVIFGLPAVAIALAILLFVRERGTDRAAARAEGSVRAAFGRILRDRDLRWLYLTSVLGGGGRGLGVVNLFALST